MWTVFKVLGWILCIACMLAPIVWVGVRIARAIMKVVHEAKLAGLERKEAAAHARQAQLSRYRPDDRGLGGIVHDSQHDTYTDTDTGERWRAGGSTRTPDPERVEAVGKQRLFASLGGVKVQTKAIKEIAQGERPMLDEEMWLGDSVPVPSSGDVEV